ncbi:IPT/TIG domain-containing protein [Capillimicrobium parvum]|uniref:IPT/TIG domain-containing protein n=1 Tax=Capillimicrobium parvum TaxID=2884022 RepID=A0A9E6Y454_9ACTN|nr:IPT/TIG domain-containing protein [Capillimicrobium parvum]UGS38856.1 hypothetical protein DSM104329_05287 [Capillimicrobium parvum]
MKALKVLLLSSLLVLAVSATAAAESVSGPDGKIDSSLRRLAVANARGQSIAPLAADSRLTLDGAERVLVDVAVRGDAKPAGAMLAAAGMQVTGTSDAAPVALVEGWLAVGQAGAVAQLDVTRAISPVTAWGTDDAGQETGETDVGAVTSAGDAAHNGPTARALGATGAGVKVGVMSDSISHVGTGVSGSKATGDLPANVQILDDHIGGTDEGRAMAEIIYDMAPGITDLLFATGGGGPVLKANNITALANAGVRVIADDIFYLSEPFFQDGVVAQAVDAAKAAGVGYFASAGNRARQSWQGTYAASANQNNDFGGGDQVQSVASVAPGRFIQIVLQWDEPWGQAQTDLDAGLVDMANVNGGFLRTSIDDNVATGLPRETITWTNTTGSAKTVGLVIQRYAGARNPLMKWIGFGGTYAIEHDTKSDAINPDAASASGSLAVAAIDAAEPGHDDVESFSSRGLKTRLFDKDGVRFGTPQVRQKPQLAAADGVQTTVPGFKPFYGTSAAAPSAAGVAALVISARPSMNVDELRAIMTNPANAIDCSLAGNPDTDCGSGFILADKAVAQAKGASAAPAITSFTPANGPTGTTVTVNGTNFTGATAVAFNGRAATFTVASATKVTAKVPDGATTGRIKVTTPKGTATSATDFTPTLTVTSLAPASGPAGTVVTIAGAGFNPGSVVKFNGVTAAKTFKSATSLTATVPATATTGKVTVTNTTGVAGTAASPAAFTVTAPPAPSITSFTPTGGPAGTVVTITGRNLTGASAVTFNAKAAPTFTVVSPTQIKATVPATATTGRIGVRTAGGTATSPGTFTMLAVTSLTPASGPTGSQVTIAGSGFNATSVVKFNGAKAVSTFVSATSLKATVPASATTGRVTVSNPTGAVGTATSAASFTVTAPPVPKITTLSPGSGLTGAQVTITGSGFTGATAVSFNGLAAGTFTAASDTKVTATVPNGATTGKVRVVAPGGTATSATDFTVRLSITSFSPGRGPQNATVTVNGVGFDASSRVRFNGAAATTTLVSATNLRAVVPATATTGPITVTNTSSPSGTVTSATTFTKQ